MNIHFIEHESFEGPGYFEYWAKDKGYTCSYSRVYLGDVLPIEAADFDCLIVLGGPQNPVTTTQECAYFNSKEEQRLIRTAIHSNKAVVGVCLGAQLIGEALGARYEHSPEKEIGYYPIQLTASGKHDHKLAAFSSTEIVGHWHNDMPGLTDSAQVIATSEGCPRQIVRYSHLVYGFQCHLEFVANELADLINVSNSDFAKSDQHKYIQSPSKILSTPTETMNNRLSDFLNKLMDEYCLLQ